tara:strand:- start:1479 stop:1970 length:492 start_codon:yes stop_codon:yes gene_type:complete
MKTGILNLFVVLCFLLKITSANAQEKINLNEIQPTFEEEESQDAEQNEEITKIKSKQKKKLKTKEIVVKLRALDKITAKTSDINILIGEKKRFGYLEIFPKNCKKSLEVNNSGVVAYLQVKDLSDKRDEKLFVFNGWTFSSNPTLRPFDHPVYDLWVTGCENI